MPANKNALIRYKTIDSCLRRKYRRWTLDDLVEACSDALYEYEGIRTGICARTIQNDLHVMRSEKLGYNAPIEVYDHRFYRYANPSYSIHNIDDAVKNDFILQGATEERYRLARSLKAEGCGTGFIARHTLLSAEEIESL